MPLNYRTMDDVKTIDGILPYRNMGFTIGTHTYVPSDYNVFYG